MSRTSRRHASVLLSQSSVAGHRVQGIFRAAGGLSIWPNVLKSGSLTAVLKAMFGRDTELWKRRTQDSQGIYTSVEKFDYTRIRIHRLLLHHENGNKPPYQLNLFKKNGKLSIGRP